MGIFGDWRSPETIHAERARNLALQNQYKAYETMINTVNPYLQQQMNTTSPAYMSARSNAMGDIQTAGRVGGNMMARQLNQQGINPASTGYTGSLANYYAKLAQQQAQTMNQLQNAEEQRKQQAMQMYYNINQGGQNALSNVQWNNSVWDKLSDIAGLYGNIAGMGSGQGNSMPQATAGINTGNAGGRPPLSPNEMFPGLR